VLTRSASEGLSIESVRDKWSVVTEMNGGNFPTSNQEATMELVEKIRPEVSAGDAVDDVTSGLDHVSLWTCCMRN